MLGVGINTLLGTQETNGCLFSGLLVTARSCSQVLLGRVAGGGVWVEKCIVDASICSPAGNC